ncbi:ABC transporter permease [Lactovum odontotermitis]
MKNIIKQREIVSLLFVVVLFIMVGFFNPKFLAVNNIFQIINSSSIYVLVALGMGFVLFIGEIDVSVGATLGFSAAIAAKLVNSGMSIPLIFLIVALFGAVIGIINAIGVVGFEIPSIIMTLGTMGIIRGAIYIYTGGIWLQNFPKNFMQITQNTLAGTFTILFIVLILLTVLLYLFTKFTLFGKSFKAVGDNIDGARLIGIPVKRVKVSSFIICGVFAAVAGVLYASRVGFVTPMDGNGYEMTAIAACVIGGINLIGGEGTPFGAMIGAILMSSLSSILVFLGFPSTYNNTITGVILIAIVVVGAITNQRAAEKLRKLRLLARVSEKPDAVPESNIAQKGE